MEKQGQNMVLMLRKNPNTIKALLNLQHVTQQCTFGMKYKNETDFANKLFFTEHLQLVLKELPATVALSSISL